MIDALSRHAKRLAFMKPVFFMVGLAGAGLFAWQVLVATSADEEYTVAGVIMLMWGIVGFAAIGLFRDVPPPAQTGDGFGARLMRKIQRGFFHLLALIVVGLTLVGIYLSFRLFDLAGA